MKPPAALEAAMSSSRSPSGHACGGCILFAALFYLWAVKPYVGRADGCARAARRTTGSAGARASGRGARHGRTRGCNRSPIRRCSAMQPTAVRRPRRRDGQLGAGVVSGRSGATIARLAAGRQHAPVRRRQGRGANAPGRDPRASPTSRERCVFCRRSSAAPSSCASIDSTSLAPAGSNDDPSETLTITATISGFAIATTHRGRRPRRRPAPRRWREWHDEHPRPRRLSADAHCARRARGGRYVRARGRWRVRCARPSVPALAARPVAALAVSPMATRPPADIASALDGDLFSPDRQPPDEPFRMPGETVADDGPRSTRRSRPCWEPPSPRTVSASPRWQLR